MGVRILIWNEVVPILSKSQKKKKGLEINHLGIVGQIRYEISSGLPWYVKNQFWNFKMRPSSFEKSLTEIKIA
jgi:hypothetical protein